MNPEKITLDNDTYIREDCVKQNAVKLDGMEYVMCRTYSAGVFAGYLSKREGQEVTLKNARRIWQWAGAATLSQLSTDGTSDPSGCKFPCEVDEIVLLQAIEIIPITDKAKKSIAGVEILKK